MKAFTTQSLRQFLEYDIRMNCKQSYITKDVLDIPTQCSIWGFVQNRAIECSSACVIHPSVYIGIHASQL